MFLEKINFGPAKIVGSKIIECLKNILGAKQIFGPKKCGSKNMLRPKKLWVRKNFRSKINFGSKKIFRCKEILGPKNVEPKRF